MFGSAIRRSKGCLTCRKRRIRCDEKHPVCERCTKRGISCVYGDGPTKFVDERPKLEARAAAAQFEQPPSSVIRLFPSTPMLFRSPSPIFFPEEIPLSGQEEQMYMSFLHYKPLIGHEFQDTTLVYAGQGPGPSAAEDSALRLSIQSLAASYFGRIHRQDTICLRARHLYGRALESLARDLNEQGQNSYTQILSSIVALTMYEMLTFQGATGWVQHAGGLARLLEVIGPKAVQRGQPHMILYFSRMVILWQTLAARKPCFLEREDWKTVPYEFDPETESSPNTLFNLMISLPRLITEAENLSSLEDTNEYHRKLEALRREVPGFLPKLYEWRWRWEAERGDRAYTILPSRNITRAYDEDGCPIFESLIWYSDLGCAADIVQYNTALILFKTLHLMLTLPEPPVPPLPPGVVPKQPTTAGILNLPGQAKTTQDCALEICRSMDFHMLPVHAGPGALELLAPVRFTYMNLESGSKAAHWLEKVCQEIADNVGFEMGRYMVWTRSDLAQTFSHATGSKFPDTILGIDKNRF